MIALANLGRPAAFAGRLSGRSMTLASSVRDWAGLVRDRPGRECAVATFRDARRARKFGDRASAARRGEHPSLRTGEASRGSTRPQHESDGRNGLTGRKGALRASASARSTAAPEVADRAGNGGLDRSAELRGSLRR